MHKLQLSKNANIYQKPFLASSFQLKMIADAGKVPINDINSPDVGFVQLTQIGEEEFSFTVPVTVGAFYSREELNDKYDYIEHGKMKHYYYKLEVFNKEDSKVYEEVVVYAFYACEPKNYAEVYDLVRASEKTFKLVSWIFQEAPHVPDEKCKISTGFYRAYVDHHGALHYTPIQKIKKSTVIHSAYDEIHEDIEFFFNTLLPLDLKQGRPGSRKILLTGTPGTGKTSIISDVALKYEKTANIAFCDSAAAFMAHLSKIDKYDVQCIVIFEDCEQLFEEQRGGSNSGTLNTLSGTFEAKNEKGTYIIMTTNEPQRIETKVKKRPDRVDTTISVGPLKDEYLTQCFTTYLNAYFDTSKFNVESIASYFAKNDNLLTGAEVMSITMYMVHLAVKKLQKDIKNKVEGFENKVKEDYVSEELIEEALELIEKKFLATDNVEKSNLQSKTKQKKVGY